MYELPQEDLKAGLFKRLSIGLLISGVFVLLKDVLFNWGERAEARADSVQDTETSRGRTDPPSLVLIETPEQRDQGNLRQTPKYSRANSLSDAIDGFPTVEQSIYAEPLQVQSRSGPALAATKAGVSVGPVVGSVVNDQQLQVGGGITGSGRGSSGGGGFGDTLRSEGDTDGSRLTGNRAPVAIRPARLNSLLVDQTALILAAGLLQNVTDADGDALSVQDLSASSGNLVDAGAGIWLFTPDLNDTSEVIFSYNVTDGTESTPQTALLDLLPLPDGTAAGSDAPATIVGALSDDTGDAVDGDQTAAAQAVEETINGDGGSNRILGGEGNDVIFGGAGDDTILAGDGDDTIFGGGGNDVIFGENGQDLISAEAGEDIVDGGDGNDQIVATVSDGNDIYFGGVGSDTYDLSGTEADATVDLASGTASSSQTGNDNLSGIENVIGGAGDDSIVGSDADNAIQGGPGSDDIDGGAGDDRFVATVSDGDDFYSGGVGSDTYDLSGTTAGVVVDLALGAADGADIGHDNLSGIENVVGGPGDDLFIASKLFNVFTGGQGNDIFKFGGIITANGIGMMRDQIADFQVGDRIDLTGFDALLMLAGKPGFELVVDKLEFSDSGKVEVRFQGFGEDERTVVEVKIGEDGDIETEIELHGRHDLTTDDFIGVS